MNNLVQSRRYTASLAAALSIVAFVGCGQNQATYSPNEVYLRVQERQTAPYAKEQLQDIVNAMHAMFGSPDEPHLVSGVEGLDDVVDMKRVASAAGPVSTDSYGNGEGLYRQHCVHCHGISGDGKGPTAWALNPYPRDFTLGKFKFKSTPIGIKPTDDDIRKTLMNGINGTAMPSFALLSEGEIEALVDYVKFLSIRGEVERTLIELNADFYDSEATPEENEDARKEFLAREFLADEVLTEVVQNWSSAEEGVTEIEERPAVYDRSSPEFSQAELDASAERGKKLYYTSIANCYSCHGPSQLGNGQVDGYDDWTKDYYRDVLPGENEEVDVAFKNAGGLTPRNILPRNLRKGIYRGGRRPIDIFWRIRNGIEGTTMPAATPENVPTEQVWDLVNYVLSLPYEQASRPGVDLTTNKEAVN